MGLLDSLVGSSGGLAVGESAPAFSLKDQHGKKVSLADFAGRKNVVVYFYPKDDTPGCTKESCTFRDQYTAFTDIGAEVLGISSDSEQSHLKFAEKYKLPFPLLADAGGEVRKQFRVPKSLGLLPGRVTFVIDKKGVIRYKQIGPITPEALEKTLLPLIRELNA